MRYEYTDIKYQCQTRRWAAAGIGGTETGATEIGYNQNYSVD